MMDDARINLLLEEFIDGEISTDDLAALQEVLAERPEIRRRYFEALAVDHLLEEAFGLPDYCGMRSRMFAESERARSMRKRWLMWSVGLAGIGVAAALALFMVIRFNRPEVPLAHSADARYSMNGGQRGTKMVAGDTLELEAGVVTLRLQPSVTAWMEGPAKLTLLDKRGNIDIKQGRAYFEITKPTGDRDKSFGVRTPAGTVRDIGTKFGVSVAPDGSVEAHVMDGTIEILGANDTPVATAKAGEGLRWKVGEAATKIPVDAGGFIRAMPQETLVFSDDFSDIDEPAFTRKPADVGGPWLMVTTRGSSCDIKEGRFDTSHGTRVASASFRCVDSGEGSAIYMVSLQTEEPSNMGDKPGPDSAFEQITFNTRDGMPLFSMLGRSKSGHRWLLRDEGTGNESEPSDIPVMEPRKLTLLYNSLSGSVELFEGYFPDVRRVRRIDASPGKDLGGLSIRNKDTGDLSLDEISVRAVLYPRHKISKTFSRN
jgi:ferric-dicitrate binding protein FerR (iron transport regulator)